LSVKITLLNSLYFFNDDTILYLVIKLDVGVYLQIYLNSFYIKTWMGFRTAAESMEERGRVFLECFCCRLIGKGSWFDSWQGKYMSTPENPDFHVLHSACFSVATAAILTEANAAEV